MDRVDVGGPERSQHQPLGAHDLRAQVDGGQVEGQGLPRMRSTEISMATRAGFSRGFR